MLRAGIDYKRLAARMSNAPVGESVMCRPEGRTRADHVRIVWCNFCDMFKSREEFDRMVKRSWKHKGFR